MKDASSFALLVTVAQKKTSLFRPLFCEPRGRGRVRLLLPIREIARDSDPSSSSSSSPPHTSSNTQTLKEGGKYFPSFVRSLLLPPLPCTSAVSFLLFLLRQTHASGVWRRRRRRRRGRHTRRRGREAAPPPPPPPLELPHPLPPPPPPPPSFRCAFPFLPQSAPPLGERGKRQQLSPLPG